MNNNVHEVLHARIVSMLRLHSPMNARELGRRLNFVRYGLTITKQVLFAMVSDGEISIQGNGTKGKPRTVIYLYPLAEKCPTCGQPIKPKYQN